MGKIPAERGHGDTRAEMGPECQLHLVKHAVSACENPQFWPGYASGTPKWVSQHILWKHCLTFTQLHQWRPSTHKHMCCVVYKPPTWSRPRTAGNLIPLSWAVARGALQLLLFLPEKLQESARVSQQRSSISYTQTQPDRAAGLEVCGEQEGADTK